MKVIGPLSLLIAAFVPTAWSTPTLSSIGSSITVADGNSSGSGWYGNHEDNETEAFPFTIKAQSWDLEGMYLNNRSLTMVGGFDFRNGTTYDNHTYLGGDIFISTGSPSFTQAANGGSGLGGTVANTFGYDYVIHFDANVSSYSVYQLTSQSIVQRTGDVAASNPWLYVSGGTAVAGYQNKSINGYGLLTQPVYGNLTTQGSTTTGLQGYGGDNNHYFLTVDTSFLPTNSTATFHYTMECGNDNLMGRARMAPSVPETGSILALLGFGFAPLCFWRRKSLKR